MAVPSSAPLFPRTPARHLPAVGGALAWAATGVALVLGGLMFVPALLGMQRYVITGGSMSGSYERGSVVFADVVRPADLRVGDVITYEPPADAGSRGLVTHRIHDIRERQGERIYRTKGDANAVADPWQFKLPHDRQARARFSVPFAGYAFAALSERVVRVALIGLPALLIALAVLGGMWRDAGADARRRCGREALSR